MAGAGHTSCYGPCSDHDSWRQTLVDRVVSTVLTITMITRELTILSLTLMSKHCLCQTFWDSFFKISPIQNNAVITNMASEEEEDASKYDNQQLDYKSWDSPYGLIQDVLGSDRKSRQFVTNWGNNDVLLDDGDLLVLKGGLLNPYTGPKKRKRKKTNNGRRRSYFVTSDNSFEPSQRISLTSLKEVRRSDRYDDSDNTGDITGHDTDQDTNWTVNDRATLLLESDTPYLNLFGFNVQCFIC